MLYKMWLFIKWMFDGDECVWGKHIWWNKKCLHCRAKK